MAQLGQHFLKNKKVITEIICALAPCAGDVVFEIGPGHGELTEKLSAGGGSTKGGKNEKLKIISIEKDGNLCKSLKKQFKNNKEIEIICGDALKLLPPLISKCENVKLSPKYKIVGNIPYYITGHLLRIISELKNKPERCIFMLQKEVAERIAVPSASGEMNRLAASVQFWAEPKIIAKVPKNDFRPVPKVDSAIILLLKKDVPTPCNARDYYAAVRTLFSQPRKTILNNIYSGIGIKKSLDHKGNYKKERVASALENIGINPESRPQNLSILNITAIAKIFFKG